MDVIERLTKQGKDLGYEGETLQTFVKEQQIELRDERKAMRQNLSVKGVKPMQNLSVKGVKPMQNLSVKGVKPMQNLSAKS